MRAALKAKDKAVALVLPMRRPLPQLRRRQRRQRPLLRRQWRCRSVAGAVAARISFQTANAATQANVLNRCMKKSLSDCDGSSACRQMPLVWLQTRTEPSFGLFVLHPEADMISGHLADKGTWDPHVLGLVAALSGACNRGEVFVDVGANIGFFSLVAGARGCRVIAIEPQPTPRRALNATICAHLAMGTTWAAHVEIVRDAVSLRDGTLITFASPMMGNFGVARAVSSRGDRQNLSAGCPVAPMRLIGGHRGPVECMSVNSRRLDSLLAHVGPIAAMKLDVEGSELDAIESMMDLLRKRRVRAVILEFNLNTWYQDLPPARRALAGADIMTTLAQLGFVFFEVVADEEKAPATGADGTLAWPAMELHEVDHLSEWTEDVAYCRKHMQKRGFCLPDILLLQRTRETQHPTKLGHALLAASASTATVTEGQTRKRILLEAGPRLGPFANADRPIVPHLRVVCIQKGADACADVRYSHR